MNRSVRPSRELDSRVDARAQPLCIRIQIQGWRPRSQRLGQRAVVQGHGLTEQGSPGRFQGVAAGVGADFFSVHVDRAVAEPDRQAVVVGEQDAERGRAAGDRDLAGRHGPLLTRERGRGQRGKGHEREQAAPSGAPPGWGAVRT